jgi:hypothetical protein
MEKKIEKGDIWTGNSTRDQRTLLVVLVIEESKDQGAVIRCLNLANNNMTWEHPNNLTSYFQKVG